MGLTEQHEVPPASRNQRLFRVVRAHASEQFESEVNDLLRIGWTPVFWGCIPESNEYAPYVAYFRWQIE